MGGHDFTEDALNIRFNSHEGAGDQPILRAELRDSVGRYHEKDKNLSEEILYSLGELGKLMT